MSLLTEMVTGARALAAAPALLNRPGVRRYVIIPFAINLLLFGGLIWYGYGQFAPLVAWIMSFVPAFLEFLEWIIWLFFGVLSALVVFFLFTPIANIVAAPFNALMAEHIEAQLTGRPVSSDAGFVRMALDAIGSQLRKLVYIGLWAAGLLLITLIPGINFLAPALWVIFGSWLLAFDYFDYPMGNHDIVFAEQKRLLRQHRGLALGFGGAVMVMTSVPVLNFLAMPFAVAGATQLWVAHFDAPRAAGGARGTGSGA